MTSRGSVVEKLGMGMAACRPVPAMGEIHWNFSPVTVTVALWQVALVQPEAPSSC